MIPEVFAKEQVRRMSRLNFFPNDGPALKELIRALEISENETVAVQTIDDIMRGETDCPKPAELRGAAIKHGESYREERNRTRPACADCGGSGWQFVHALHTRGKGMTRDGSIYTRKERISKAQYDELMKQDLPRSQTLYEGAERCSCRMQEAA